ncbi:MAG: SRPBCC family protein [Acidobacteriota bacterium]
MSFYFDQRLAFAETLPSRVYFDQQNLEVEQQRIFQRTPQMVGRLDQVAHPGSYFTADVSGQSVLVVRDSAGVLRGFHNVCRHRAGPVACGSGRRQVLQCGYHGWTYSLDGRLLGTPDFDGVENFTRETMGLHPVHVETWEQFIFVSLDGEPGLHQFLGDILPERTVHAKVAAMKFVERREYFIDCNWKVYVDNYVEGYHIPIVHPSLMKELDYEHYRTLTGRYHSLQDAPIRGGGGPDRRYQPSDSQTEALYFWMFPNLMLNVYPDNLSTNLIVPLGPERTVTIFEWFFHDTESDEAQEAISGTLALSDEIQLEDIAICEAVQRGLRSSAYDRGRYSVKRENGLHHFHSLWHEFMSAGETGSR